MAYDEYKKSFEKVQKMREGKKRWIFFSWQNVFFVLTSSSEFCFVFTFSSRCWKLFEHVQQ